MAQAPLSPFPRERPTPLPETCPIDSTWTAYQVRDIDSGLFSSRPDDLVGGTSLLYFKADDGFAGREVWRSDGSAAGTFMLKDILVDVEANGPGPLASLGDALFFGAAEGDFDDRRADVWLSDGTTEGTTIAAAGAGDDVRRVVTVGGTAFFVWQEALWKSDGTTAGTRTLRVNAGRVRGVLGAHRDRLYFLTSEPGALWQSDGTDEGTTLVSSTRPYSDVPAAVVQMVGAGDTLFTVASSGLWAHVGGAAGATLARSFPLAREIENAVAVGSEVCFTYGSKPSELWRSDGTPEGTRLLRTFAAGFGDRSGLTLWGGRLFFFADDGAAGLSLWTSDGTPEGTTLVKQVQAHGNPLPFGARLLFGGDDGVHGTELWTSDGTQAGTRIVKDINAGAARGFLGEPPVQVCGRAFFQADDGNHGIELWMSDGTEGGTRLLRDICPGAQEADLDEGLEYATAVGERLFFQANDCRTGSELWAWGAPTAPAPTAPPRTPPPGPNHAPSITGYAGSVGNTSNEVRFKIVDTDGDDSHWTLAYRRVDDRRSLASREGWLHSGRSRTDVTNFGCECDVEVTIAATDDRGAQAQPLTLTFHSW